MNTMIRLLIAAAVIGLAGAILFPKTAHGQTPCPATPTCEPYTTTDRTKCGPELKGRTGNGEWRGWWYAVAPDRWCAFKWVSLDKVAPKTLADTLKVVDAIKAASSPTQGIMDAITAFVIKPAVGSQDEIDLELLRYAACQAMVASPPSSLGWTAPGPSCVLKVFPPTVEVWKATGGTIFTFAAGKLTGVTSRKATAGAACNCAARYATASTTYCPLASGPPTEATACKQ